MYFSVLLVLLPLTWFFWGFLASLSGAIALVLFHFVIKKQVSIFLLLLIALITISRLELKMSHPLPREFQHSKVELTACLNTPLVFYDEYSSVTASVVNQPASIKLRNIRVVIPNILVDENLKVGACITGMFRVRQPIGYLVRGTFSSDRYYFSSHIDAKATLVSTSSVKNHPSLTQRIYLTRVDDFSHSSNLSLWAALTLGWSGSIDPEIKRLLAGNQLMHLFVISGMHIGLISAFLLLVVNVVASVFSPVAPVPYKYRYLLVLVLVAVYVGMIGWPIPAVRALLMAIVPFGCFFFGVKISPFHSLLYSAMLILLLFPEAWLGIGTWLSFISVFLIVMIINTPLYRQIHWFLKLLLFQGFMSLSIVPWAMFIGLKVNPISVLISLIVTPFVTVVLVPLSFLIIIISSDKPIRVFEWAIDRLFAFLSETSLFSFSMAWHSIGVVVLGCGLILMMSYWVDRHSRILVLLLIFLLVSSVVLSPLGGTRQDTTVTVFDVGHGLAMLYSGEDGQWLYDTGGSLGVQTLFEVNLERQIKELKGLIISHSDNDHASAANYVANQYQPILKWSGQPNLNTTPIGQSEFKSCHSAGEISPYLRFIPVPTGLLVNDNNHSCVLLIDTGYGRLIVTGDSDKLVEYYLLQEYPEIFPVDVVVLGHHGSGSSSSSAWLEENNQSLFVLSTSDRYSPKWPAQRIVEWFDRRESQLLSTAEIGTIEITFAEQGISVKSWDSAYRKHLIY